MSINSQQLMKRKDQCWVLQQNQCITQNMEKAKRQKPAKPCRPILIVNCRSICLDHLLYFKTVQVSHDFFHYLKYSFCYLNRLLTKYYLRPDTWHGGRKDKKREPFATSTNNMYYHIQLCGSNWLKLFWCISM